MILIALLIGAVLIVAAVRNSQAALFSALGQDVPGFVVWAAAIVAVGVVGFVPNLKPVSRGLLALVVLVIVLKNYQNVISGFQSLWQSPPKTSNAATSGTSTSGGASIGSILGNQIGSAGGSLLSQFGVADPTTGNAPATSIMT